MKKLFLVQLSSWRCHYVMAVDFNEAITKVMAHVEINTPVISEDGSLQSVETVVVKEIKMLSENVIR